MFFGGGGGGGGGGGVLGLRSVTAYWRQAKCENRMKGKLLLKCRFNCYYLLSVCDRKIIFMFHIKALCEWFTSCVVTHFRQSVSLLE